MLWISTPVEPGKRHSIDEKRLVDRIKQCWLESGGHSVYRNIYEDLLEAKIDCGQDRVLRLMRLAGIRAQRGYKTPKGY